MIFIKTRIFFKNKNFNDDGQIFLIGGVMITLVIISLAVLSIQISEVTSSYTDKYYLKNDYENICEEFGIMLEDKLGENLRYVSGPNDAIIVASFNEINDYFSYASSLHGTSFHASYNATNSNVSSSAARLRVYMSLSNEYDCVQGEIDYYIIPNDE